MKKRIVKSGKKQCTSLVLLLLTAILALLASGCQKAPGKKDSTPVSPLSTLTWESTYEDMTALEGEALEGRESIYGGLAYDYPKEFMERSGTISYMFDEEERLVCIGWSYSASSPEELDAAYQAIYQDVAKSNGESGEEAKGLNNYGDVWRRQEGNIILSAVASDSASALLYSYLSPLVSTLEVERN